MTHRAAPIKAKFWTPGVVVLAVLMASGAAAIAARFIGGIGYVSNLTTARPWGLWIGVDVASGVALAAGGFTTSALAHIFHREHYHAIVRPALLTAMLGYTFVGMSLMVDLGKYLQHLASDPSEHVAGELGPVRSGHVRDVLPDRAVSRVRSHTRGRAQGKAEPARGPSARPRGVPPETGLGPADRRLADRFFGKIMFLLIIAGVVLSCMHQSSLGALMAIAPYKVHPLWYTPS